MYGLQAPDVERWSSRVVVVRGLNPGPFTGPGTNTYLVGTGSSPILIDTGSGVDGYVPLLEKALRDEFDAARPSQILLTHAHRDHLGGVHTLLRHFGHVPVSKLPWPARDEALRITATREGDSFYTDGVRLRALHCPGHAQDHLCFYLEEEQALFTGDVVLGMGTTVIPLEGGDMAAYLASLRRIRQLPLERIYPGHGPKIDDPLARVDAYIEHRAERERQILDAMRAGAATVREMVERIYRETPRSLHAAAAQSVLSHLRKLEAEKRVRPRVDAGGETHWTLP